MSYFKRARKYNKPSETIDEKIAKANQEFKKTGVLDYELREQMSTKGLYYADKEIPAIPAEYTPVPDPNGVTQPGFTPPNSGYDANDPSTWDNAFKDTDWLRNPNEVAGETDRQAVLGLPDSMRTAAQNSRLPHNSARYPDAAGEGGGFVIAGPYWGTALGYLGKNGEWRQVLSGGLVGGTNIPHEGSRGYGGYYNGLTDAEFENAVWFWEKYQGLIAKYGSRYNIPTVSTSMWIPWSYFWHGSAAPTYEEYPYTKSNGMVIAGASVVTEGNEYESSPYVPAWNQVIFQDDLGNPSNLPIKPLDEMISDLYEIGSDAVGGLLDELQDGLTTGYNEDGEPEILGLDPDQWETVQEILDAGMLFWDVVSVIALFTPDGVSNVPAAIRLGGRVNQIWNVLQQIGGATGNTKPSNIKPDTKPGAYSDPSTWPSSPTDVKPGNNNYSDPSTWPSSFGDPNTSGRPTKPTKPTKPTDGVGPTGSNNPNWNLDPDTGIVRNDAGQPTFIQTPDGGFKPVDGLLPTKPTKPPADGSGPVGSNNPNWNLDPNTGIVRDDAGRPTWQQTPDGGFKPIDGDPNSKPKPKPKPKPDDGRGSLRGEDGTGAVTTDSDFGTRIRDEVQANDYYTNWTNQNTTNYSNQNNQRQAPPPTTPRDALQGSDTGGLTNNNSPLQQFKDWWNSGRNERVTGSDGTENSASWSQLFADDRAQVGKSDANFESGKPGNPFGRPDQAFNPFRPADKGGPGSGPTPAVRQTFERPGRNTSQNTSGVVLQNQIDNSMDEFFVDKVINKLTDPDVELPALINKLKKVSGKGVNKNQSQGQGSRPVRRRFRK